jgi:hypothetical protein
MGLYEHMPADIRETVDEIVDVLRTEPWPERFAALHWLLCDRVEESTREPLHLLQEWTGILTAVLERLGPDSEAVECLALMGISFNDEWRAQAIARMDRDPNVFDELCATYPDWNDLVGDLVEADKQRPVKRS